MRHHQSSTKNLLETDNSAAETSYSTGNESPRGDERLLKTGDTECESPTNKNIDQTFKEEITGTSERPSLDLGENSHSNMNESPHRAQISTASTGQPVPSGAIQVDSIDQKRIRNWERFPGKNKFHCDGRIIMARQTGILYFTISLILITVTLFFVFECRLTLVTELYCGFLIPIFAAILLAFSLACLLRTAWSDPGIIPRATPSEAVYLEKCLQAQQAKEAASIGQQGYRPPPRVLEVVVNGQPIKLKYCFTCKIFRPPRASHCSLCDNCVDCFDHHCPWVGNCVGRRNYRYFYLFVTSLSILCVYIFAFSIVHLVMYTNIKGSFWEALKNSPGSALELFICFFSVWSVFGLAGFHSYLIALSMTTNEDIKGSWSKKRNKDMYNPFDKGGCIKNFSYILCGPVPPSAINRRGFVPEVPDIEEMDYEEPGPSQPAEIDDFNTNGASYPRQPQYKTLSNGNDNGPMPSGISRDEPSRNATHPQNQYNTNHSFSAGAQQPYYVCGSLTTPIMGEEQSNSLGVNNCGHLGMQLSLEDSDLSNFPNKVVDNDKLSNTFVSRTSENGSIPNGDMVPLTTSQGNPVNGTGDVDKSSMVTAQKGFTKTSAV